MRILRSADHRRMPWKNGGGETTEVIVSPANAGLDDFDWRVSMARVETDGPFSSFPGIDRTLAILEGEGLVLKLEGRIPIGLTSRSEPLPFPADVPTSAGLIGGPIVDLNVMSRRGKVRHSVERLHLGKDEAVDLPTLNGSILILCHRGTIVVSIGDSGPVTLGPLDAAVLESTDRPISLESKGSSSLFALSFSNPT